MKESSFPTIKTDRLILRRFELSDASDVQRMAGDKDVAFNTLNMPYPYLDGMAEEWILSLENGFKDQKSIVYAICLKSTGILIGAIGLTLNLKYRMAELGYWVGREYWNNGYCTEAVRALITFAFENYKLHKIYANYFSNNPASGRVMIKAGLQYEGTLKSHMWHHGEYKDLIFYSIFNPDI